MSEKEKSAFEALSANANPFPAQGMKAPSWRLPQAIWQVRKPESGRHLRATQRPVSNPGAVMRKEKNNAAYQTKR